MTDKTRTLYQDGSEETYQCGETACGYTGDIYCQNCGYAPDERDDAPAFGALTA